MKMHVQARVSRAIPSRTSAPQVVRHAQKIVPRHPGGIGLIALAFALLPGLPAGLATAGNLAGAVLAQAAPTETSLHSDPRPSVLSEPVTLTAIVSSAQGTPEGRVRFFDSRRALGVARLDPLSLEQTLTAGNEHSCVVSAGGGLRCTGRNVFGELGIGNQVLQHRPRGVHGLQRNIRAVSSSGRHNCALTHAGAVLCWGHGASGQLGDGATTNRFTPTPVSGLDSGVTAIAAGWYHSCALTDQGGVLCWGANGEGQLGDGTTTQQNIPVQVAGLSSGVVAIAAGARHSCALRRSGTVLCWGENSYGKLGDGTTTNRDRPVRVRRLPGDITAISIGQHHSCALTASGGVRCWGYGGFGELGNGTWQDSALPVRVQGQQRGVTSISAGQNHTCALRRNGTLRCWGAGAYGQLGDGGNASSNVPVRVNGIRGVTAVAAGVGHSCALRRNGVVMCWGNGVYGQLGFGPLSTNPNDNIRRSPVRMRGGAFGAVEGVSVAVLVTDALRRGRRALTARYLGSDDHRRSVSEVRRHLVLRN